MSFVRLRKQSGKRKVILYPGLENTIPVASTWRG